MRAIALLELYDPYKMDPRIQNVIETLSQDFQRYTDGRLTCTGLIYEIIDAAQKLRALLSMEETKS